MNSEWLVAICSLAGTCIGTFSGIKLISYRLEQLEKKVEKHNTVIERTYKLEENQSVIFEKLKVEEHRISDLEDDLKNE